MSNLWYRLTHPNIGFSLTKGGWLLHGGLSRSERVMGFRNTLKDGSYFPVWEFDNTPLDVVVNELERVQIVFNLPPITVLRSSSPNNYHAYCFKRMTWPQLIELLMDTQFIDPSWLKLGFVREHFVLRFTAKGGEVPVIVRRLDVTGQAPDFTFNDISEGTAYWTVAKANV